MPESHHDEVRGLPIFANMSDDNFGELIRASYVQNFPPQIQLIEEGDSSDFLYIVLAGAVELFSSWNNRETSMATVRPISTFILAATIKDGPYLMSARTMEKSRLALIPSSDVRSVFDKDSEFARAVVTELAQCYRTVVKNTKDLKLRTSLERLANYILRQNRRNGRSGTFHFDGEKRRLASFLGMTPENLSRAFKNLQAYGVIVEGNQVTITDPADLEKFAKSNPLIDDYST